MGEGVRFGRSPVAELDTHLELEIVAHCGFSVRSWISAVYSVVSAESASGFGARPSPVSPQSASTGARKITFRASANSHGHNVPSSVISSTGSKYRRP